ncbi:MAG TPA: DUF5668 domain-containing protein [Vicinamibacteria bacterium]|nr:DUF5668 domain-containing protein [Vicinamibacteria bacterium]
MTSDLADEGTAPPLPPTVPPALPAPAAYVKVPKNPWLAVLFSFVLPGLGQVYNGEPARALVFFFGFVGSIYLTAEASPFPFAFLIPFIFIYGLIDAHRRSTAINRRFLGGAPAEEERDSESPAWGATLVAVGLLLLLNNLGWLDVLRLQRYWPSLLILAGAWFIYASVQKRKAESGDEPRV